MRLVFTVLAESVAARLRDCCVKCQGVQIFLRDNALFTLSRQKKMEYPCCTSGPILETAMELFRQHYRWQKPLRSLSLSAIYLVTANRHMQLSLFDDTAEQLLVQEQIEKTIDMLRYRFGHNAVLRASALLDPHHPSVQLFQVTTTKKFGLWKRDDLSPYCCYGFYVI